MPNNRPVHASAPREVEGYFEAALGAACAAERAAGGPCVRHFRLGGLRVALRFAGPALEGPMTDALRHLADDGAVPPDLTIHVWDSASTGTAAPPSPLAWDPEAAREDGQPDPEGRRYGVHGELTRFNTAELRTSFHVWPNSLRMLHAPSGRALHWIDDARHLPSYERSAPFLNIFSWWMATRDRPFMHAAAVGTGQGGVLLVGRGGSGKSTTALACLAGGLLYAGDDYCLLDDGPRPWIHGLYATAKLKGDADFARFPSLRAAVCNPGRKEGEKALLLLHPAFADQLSAGFALRAIVFPRRCDVPAPRLLPMSPAAMLTEMAPSTLRQLHGGGRRAFAAMTRAVRAVPCFALETGPDVAALPGAIRRLLETLRP